MWPQPRVIGGQLIFNLVPHGSPHKGSALTAVMKRVGCTHAIFIGDDLTDEDAFGQPGKILSIRVGRQRGSLARFYIQGQQDMLALLEELMGRLE
ncbi:MAG: hypothetical protein HC883_05850 [Bdellovibrionaceae bacterium]|nr:hypothetical protein [Pseudobdellovibrionaceae bacterium]